MKRPWVQPLIQAIACIIAGVVIANACSVNVGKTERALTAEQNTYHEDRPHTMKTYVIVINQGDNEIRNELTADRISESNDCILFWRGATLDTVLCEHMARVLVTEKN